MNKLYRISTRKLLAVAISSAIFATGFTGLSASFAEVIDEDHLEESIVTLKDVYEDMIESDDYTFDEYRAFYHDYYDTAEAFHVQMQHDRDILKKVTDVLLDKKLELVQKIESYEGVLDQYGKSRKFYDAIIDRLISNSSSASNTTQSTTLGNFTLTLSEDGFYRLYEIVDNEEYLRVATNKVDFSTYHDIESDSEEVMLNYSTVGLYKGTINESFRYNGEGALYKINGNVNIGTWENGRLSGIAYLYDKKTNSSNTAQFEKGKRNGMTVFQDETQNSVFTRVYQDDVLQGASYSRLALDATSSVDFMRYYDNNVQLPYFVLLYDEGTYRINFDDEEIPFLIYSSDVLSRVFIGQTEDNALTGYGYGVFDDIEYIGDFTDFNIEGNGTFYSLEDTENIFEQKLDEIIAEKIKDSMSESSKIKIIHDYLVSTILYHHPGISIEDHPGYSHTAYGAIMYNRAVCDGYAQAFKVFLDRFGIENKLIFGITIGADGKFSEENRHAWNLVKVGDRYLHFDLTWNDPTYSNKIRHHYYEMTSEEISKDHKWNKADYVEYLGE